MVKNVCLIILFIAVAHAAPNPKVKSYVKVKDSSPVNLSQILDWDESDVSTRKRLSQVILGDGPKLGEQRVYTNSAIAKVVRQNLPDLKGVKIPNKVTVENRGHELNQKLVKELLSSRWQRICGECEFIFKSLSLPLLPKAAMGKPWKVEVQGRLPRGSFTRRLEVQQDGGSPVVYWLSGQVEIHKKVPVVNKAVEMGHRFQESDIEFKMRDVTFATDGIPSKGAILGQVAKRSLRASDIIWFGYVTRDKAVKRGDTVRLSAGKEFWQVSLMAVAEQSGFVGDRIQVRNRKTRQVLSAVITGKGEVSIQ